MSALEDLAAAAAGVEDEDADDDEQQPSGAAMGGAAAAKPKKGRATQLEMAERAVLKFSTELAEAEGLVASVAGQGPLAAKKDKGKAARAQNRIGDLRSKLEAAQKCLEEKKAAAATAALKAEAAAAEKKAKKEMDENENGEYVPRVPNDQVMQGYKIVKSWTQMIKRQFCLEGQPEGRTVKPSPQLLKLVIESATKHIPGDPDKVKWLGKVVAQIGEAATKYEHGDLTKPPLKAGWGALTKKAGREANVPPPPSVPPPPFVPPPLSVPGQTIPTGGSIPKGDKLRDKAGDIGITVTHAELTGIVQAAVAAAVPAAAVDVPRKTLAEQDQEQVNLALKKAVRNSDHFKTMAETMTSQANQIKDMHAKIARQGAQLGTLKVVVQGLVKT